jgi:septum formation protein
MTRPDATAHRRSLILASASPRRREILTAAGFSFEVDPADVDESLAGEEAPEHYVDRVARLKAAAGARRHPGAIVLAADTIVVLDRAVLGKPRDRADATRMLRQLSGRSHLVMTGIAIAADGVVRTHVERTTVWFRRLTDEDIAWYVDSGEPMDKAGAYAIQGRAARFIPRIEGSYSNVVGLPVAPLAELLGAS